MDTLEYQMDRCVEALKEVPDPPHVPKHIERRARKGDFSGAWTEMKLKYGLERAREVWEYLWKIGGEEDGLSYIRGGTV